MNVLLAGESSGGGFTFVRTLARELDRRGCQVTVALSGTVRPRSLGVESVEMAWRPSRLEWMHEPWSDVDATGEWLLDLARLRQAQVVHVNGYAQAALPFDAPIVLTAHSDVLTWSQAVRHRPPDSEFAEYERRIRAALDGPALLVSPTSAHLNAMESVFGRLPRARVISNGSPPPSTREPKQRIVLAAGRVWDDAKNISFLGGAALPKRWSLAVAGPRRHPEGGGVSLAGARMLGDLDDNDMRGWLSRSAIFVNPAFYEPFGLAVLEAAQAGCALLLADIPTLRELWNGAALFIDPGDRLALETALWMLTSGDQLRDELSRRAVGQAERYTAAAMADEYLATYRELARASDVPDAS